VSVPEPTIAAALDARARRSPSSAPALVADSGTVVTHAELAAEVAALSGWLAGFVARHQVTAVVAGNGPAAVPVIVAAASASVCAPLPAGQTVDERTAQLRRLGASVLLVAHGGAAEEVAARQLGVPVVRLPSRAGALVDVAALPRSGPPTGPHCTAVPGTALLVHTSGSTGAGKLVPLTTAALLHAASLVAETLGLSPADRCLNVMPLHHTHGLVGAVLSSLTAGGSVICLPQYADDGMTTALGRFDPTWYTAVPAIHARVAGLAEAGRLGGHRLRFARSASAPLTEALRSRLNRALGVPVVQAYALTEAPGQVTAHRPTDPIGDGAIGDGTVDGRAVDGGTVDGGTVDGGTGGGGSVGRPAGCEVVVLDESGRPLTGAVGEIAVRGRHVAPGYLSTADGHMIAHPDGYLHTGDLGRLTTGGELFLVGRQDDMINRAGEKIVPEEIENVLAGHPDVSDVVVVGVPDPVLGDAIAAMVAGNVDEEELRRWIGRALSRDRVPDRVVLTDRIPRSPTGKVNRRDLAAALAGDRNARPQPDPDVDLVAAVSEIWSQVLLLPDLDPDADFAALGGGSLHGARIEALVAERLGVELPPAAVIEGASTARSMATLIRDVVGRRR
jgi:acyl-CoA synthetase (AMP-forming)/AMP-acid ligase II